MPQTERPTFLQRDFYLQAGIQRPQHVMHGRPEVIKVRLGGTVRFWFTLRTHTPEQVPCTARDEGRCSAGIQLVPIGTDDTTLAWSPLVQFRVGSDPLRHFNLNYAVPRDSTLGSSAFIVRVWFGDEVLFTRTFIAEITE